MFWNIIATNFNDLTQDEYDVFGGGGSERLALNSNTPPEPTGPEYESDFYQWEAQMFMSEGSPWDGK